MTIHEIRIGIKEGEPDILGEEIFTEVQRTMDIPGLTGIETEKIIRVEVTREEAIRLGENFYDPITQTVVVDKELPSSAVQTREVGYKLGVTDPEAEFIMKAAGDLGIPVPAVTTSVRHGFVGEVSPEEADAITERHLANKTVQTVLTQPPETLVVTGEVGPINTVPIRNATSEDLLALSKDKLFLNLQEMQAIQKHFTEIGRDPTDCELEIFAARWSEHCVHKTFKKRVIINGELKDPFFTRITEATGKQKRGEVLSAFDDNSGVYRFRKGKAIAIKKETHIGPSAVEPFGGAATGVGGVIRDILGTGQGGEVIASSDIFCFAPPDLDPSKLPTGTLPPDHLFRKVVEGVKVYGNNFGVPTNNGSVHFHPDFRAKPTVLVGATGLIDEEYTQKGKPALHDLVVAIGGRTGRDGIHGATFSSGEMTDRTSNVNASAVQIGNPIEEQRMASAIIEARDQGCIRAITDCGAAGFSSAVGEMGEDIGFTVDISSAPLKYQGLAPWEIWLSESQERMILAINPTNIEAFVAICRKYNVESTVLGTFDGSHRMKVMYGDQVVADLDYEFLKNGLPMEPIVGTYVKEVFEERELPPIPDRETWITTFKKVLSHWDVCSKEPIVRLFDHTVQGTNALSPYSGVHYDGPNDAAVITPILGDPAAIVEAHGLNSILNRIDPYWGTIWAGTEAMANYVAAGGNPDEVYLLNNYIWPGVDEKSIGSLDRAVDAVTVCIATYGKVISGKDSMSSRYRGQDGIIIDIPPITCISTSGVVEDVRKTMSADIKKPGSILYFVGKLDSNMGGSTYYSIHGQIGNEVPKVDLDITPKVFGGMYQAIQSGNVFACHDVSEGGVLTTVTEMCFGGDCGVQLDIDEQVSRPDMFLFNETAGCFVVEVDDDTTAKALFEGLPYMRLGTTTQTKEVKVTAKEGELFTVSLEELKQAWKEPMQKIFH